MSFKQPATTKSSTKMALSKLSLGSKPKRIQWHCFSTKLWQRNRLVVATIFNFILVWWRRRRVLLIILVYIWYQFFLFIIHKIWRNITINIFTQTLCISQTKLINFMTSTKKCHYSATCFIKIFYGQSFNFVSFFEPYKWMDSFMSIQLFRTCE